MESRGWAPAVDFFRWLFQAQLVSLFGGADGATTTSDLYEGEDILAFYDMQGVSCWMCLASFGACLGAIWLFMLLPLLFVDWRKVV